MAKAKPKFKVGQTFFHPGQNIFVKIETVVNVESKGILYTLKTYSTDGTVEPYKRYYEDKVIDLLKPMRETPALKVLYGKK